MRHLPNYLQNLRYASQQNFRLRMEENPYVLGSSLRLLRNVSLLGLTDPSRDMEIH